MNPRLIRPSSYPSLSFFLCIGKLLTEYRTDKGGSELAGDNLPEKQGEGRKIEVPRCPKLRFPPATSTDRSRFTVYFDTSVPGRRVFTSQLSSRSRSRNRRGGEETRILELLPSSRASTLETNCVCNYSALLHLITRLQSKTRLRAKF